MIQEEVRPPECNGTQNGTVQHENASVQHENASVQHENASVGKSMLKPKYSTEVALLVKQSKENPGDENPSETHVTLLKDDACAASLTSVHSMVEEVCKGRNMKVVVQDVKNGGEPENVDVDVDLKIRKYHSLGWLPWQYHTCQPFRILRNLSAFEPCIPHSSQNITESQILQSKSRFPPNGCQVSHSGHVVMVER